MWLVLGYGNLMRGDDGLGYRLAERLAGQVDGKSARIRALHQLAPELTLELAASDIERVLFMDARRGQPEIFRMGKIEPQAGVGRCGHQLSPALLLGMTAELYGRRPRAWLLTLPAADLGFGMRLSEVAQSALGVAQRRVRALLEARAS
jgi:hydrogenase maturation protease